MAASARAAERVLGKRTVQKPSERPALSRGTWHQTPDVRGSSPAAAAKASRTSCGLTDHERLPTHRRRPAIGAVTADGLGPRGGSA